MKPDAKANYDLHLRISPIKTSLLISPSTNKIDFVDLKSNFFPIFKVIPQFLIMYFTLKYMHYREIIKIQRRCVKITGK